jgi:hypothetical protein
MHYKDVALNNVWSSYGAFDWVECNNVHGTVLMVIAGIYGAVLATSQRKYSANISRPPSGV